ncbi:hypothetical protein BCV70DRAFT_220044 [Testicularia cyperi]|uniref:Uncharacterized protein n=1 Tax=Testicularia cyperi TaxID=1882483 RepID=A0A317XW90_9BASI|nr:hypothetical protein BCV70DRAFT_220044 [Testicularia cyperi]
MSQRVGNGTSELNRVLFPGHATAAQLESGTSFSVSIERRPCVGSTVARSTSGSVSRKSSSSGSAPEAGASSNVETLPHLDLQRPAARTTRGRKIEQLFGADSSGQHPLYVGSHRVRHDRCDSCFQRVRLGVVAGCHEKSLHV